MTVSRARAVALSRHVARQPDSEEYATGLECLLARSTTSRTARHATAPYTRVPFPLYITVCTASRVGPSPYNIDHTPPCNVCYLGVVGARRRTFAPRHPHR